jgi:hypothetical protein
MTNVFSSVFHAKS